MGGGFSLEFGAIECGRINEAWCRTANKERTGISPKQMLAPWQKEVDQRRGSSRGVSGAWDGERRGRGREYVYTLVPDLRKGTCHRSTMLCRGINKIIKIYSDLMVKNRMHVLIQRC